MFGGLGMEPRFDFGYTEAVTQSDTVDDSTAIAPCIGIMNVSGTAGLVTVRFTNGSQNSFIVPANGMVRAPITHILATGTALTDGNMRALKPAAPQGYTGV